MQEVCCYPVILASRILDFPCHTQGLFSSFLSCPIGCLAFLPHVSRFGVHPLLQVLVPVTHLTRFPVCYSPRLLQFSFWGNNLQLIDLLILHECVLLCCTVYNFIDDHRPKVKGFQSLGPDALFSLNVGVSPV